MTARDPDRRMAMPQEVIVALAPFASGCDLEELNRSIDPTAESFSSDSMSGIHTAEYLSIQPGSSALVKGRKEARWVPVALVAAFLLVATAVLLYSFGVFTIRT
jgi:hypothetical protein